MDTAKKNIVIAAEIFPPAIGGPATYAKRFAEVLSAQGHDVTIVTYGDPKNTHGAEGCSVMVVNRSIPLPFRYWIYAWKLFAAARHADVIYAQGPLAAGWPALTVKKMTHTRLVVKVVGDQSWERATQHGLTDLLLDDFQRVATKGKIAHIQKIQRKVLAEADAVITVSEYFKKLITQWGVPEETISVVHNAIDHRQLEGLGSFQRDAGMGIEGDIILTVARLVRWKGVSTLIEVMPELLQVNPRFKLIVIGTGPEEQALHAQVKQLHLESSVTFTGALPRTELSLYYQKAMMLVLNSGYENWSHVLLEAMHRGTPVVASRIGGNPELVHHGRTGLLADYNDKTQIKAAILEMWGNRALRTELAERAHAVVSDYSFDAMVEHTKEVIFS